MSFYRNRKVLPMSCYTKSFNNDRRARYIIIGCCLREYKVFNALLEKQQELIIKKIERGCYNYTCEHAEKMNIPKNWSNDSFIRLYNSTTFKIQKHIANSSQLVDRIVSGNIKLESMGSMKSHGLFPEKTADIYKMIEHRKKQKINKKYSTQHECFKCGGRKTTETEIQARSLDEGSTLIIQCEMDNCSNRWTLTS